jgi:uncharacterized protein YggE
MKSFFLFFLLIASASHCITGQSTERFIRIIGNAKHEFTATGIVATISISEQQANEHRQMAYVPFETVYSNYIAELSKLGIQEKQLMRSQKNMLKFSATSKEFTLLLPGTSKIEQLTAIRVPGVQITELKYTYANNNDDIEESLAKAAIEDARRKAESLCTTLNMRLGKILNIEDTSSGCCSTIEDSVLNKVAKEYKVNVTFELADK